MYCKQCGKEIPNDSEYCNYCGAGQNIEKVEYEAESAFSTAFERALPVRPGEFQETLQPDLTPET